MIEGKIEPIREIGEDFLRMRGDREDGHLSPLWPVAPEDSIGGRSPLLNVRLENLLLWTVGIFQGVENVGLKGGMPWIGLKEAEGLFDLLDEACVPGGRFQATELLLGAPGENQFKHQASPLTCFEKSSLGLTRRPFRASSNPFRTRANARLFLNSQASWAGMETSGSSMIWPWAFR